MYIIPQIGYIIYKMVIYLIIPLILGWIAGLLVNYLTDVIPSSPRSRQPNCSHCNSPTSWWDYWLLRSCRTCKHRRTTRAWLVQFLAIISTIYIWEFPPPRLGFLLGLVLLIYLSIVLIIDLEHRLILHPVSLVGAFLGLGLGILMHGFIPTLGGGFAGFCIMFIFYLFGMLFSRYRTRRMRSAGQAVDDEEALGFGDVNLALILGLILGWPLIWFGLLLGILAGGIISLLIIIWMITARRYKQQAMMVFLPYGPYFIISAILLLYLPNLIGALIPA